MWQYAHKKYTYPRIEPGTFCTESRHSTTELLRIVIPWLTIPLYLKQIACKAALNKHLFSAALNHYIIQLL